MPDLVRKTVIVELPQSHPELAPHFAALSSRNGWVLRFPARDADTGENLIVQFAPPQEAA